jgi:hypothetical protein
VQLTTGNSEAFDTGSILIRSGDSVDQRTLIPDAPTYKGRNSGNINITAGLAVNQGGNITIEAGTATGQIRRSRYSRESESEGSGGNVLIESGKSFVASSGSVKVGSAKAGSKGDSGMLSLLTGNATEGDAGMISILSGNSLKYGKGGNIEILAGASFGYEEDGPTAYLHGGTAMGRQAAGGNVEIFGGNGLSEDDYKGGGRGGRVDVTGGRAAGMLDTDIGGAVEILGGYAHYATGGQVKIESGRSERTSSGDLSIATPDAGKDGVNKYSWLHKPTGSGVSGTIKVSTGTSRNADSGSISFNTGAARGKSIYDTQDAGNISAQAGESDEGNGGKIFIAAGATRSIEHGKIDVSRLSFESIN